MLLVMRIHNVLVFRHSGEARLPALSQTSHDEPNRRVLLVLPSDAEEEGKAGLEWGERCGEGGPIVRGEVDKEVLPGFPIGQGSRHPLSAEEL